GWTWTAAAHESRDARARAWLVVSLPRPRTSRPHEGERVMAKQNKVFFSNFANCYAFAAKCANPTNASAQRHARPGGRASTGVLNADAPAFANGVIADGGNRVNALGHFSVNAFVVANIPQSRAEWYLIAMLVNKDGFHFVRRQRRRLSG